MTYRMTQRIERIITLYLDGQLDRVEASEELKRLDLTDEEIACELGPCDEELLASEPNPHVAEPLRSIINDFIKPS